MRFLLAGVMSVLVVCVTVGCGSSEEPAPVADSSTARPLPDPSAGAMPAAGGIPGKGGDMPAGDATMPGGGMPGGVASGDADAGAGSKGGLAGAGALPGDADAFGVAGIPPGVAYPGGTATPGLPGDIPGGLAYPGGVGPAGKGGTALPGDADAIGAFPGGPGGYGGVGGPGGSAPVPTTYDGFAKLAFQQGRDREALQYLQAWALTNDEGASEVLSGIQWGGPRLKRPVMAIRWGVGIQLAVPPKSANFSGDVKAIGSEQTLGKGRQGGGAAGGGDPGGAGLAGPGAGYGGGAGGGGTGDSTVATYAGDFGKAVLEQFQLRVSEGRFGAALKDAPGSRSSGGIGGPGGYPGGAGFPGGGAGFPGGFADADALKGADRGGASSNAAISSIGTGLTMLGTGTDKALMDRAVKERVDVLALFRVKVTINRAGLTINDTELEIHDPVKKEKLFSSGTLNNIKIQKEREQGKEDSVEKEVTKIFEFIDKEFTVTELPTGLTPELVKTKRVEGQLLVGTIDEPLKVLTEIRFYQRNKLLTDEDAAAAMAKVAGEANAKVLLEGKEEDRKKVVEKWLPRI